MVPYGKQKTAEPERPTLFMKVRTFNNDYNSEKILIIKYRLSPKHMIDANLKFQSLTT